jgi:hypothetical protein
VRLIRDGHNMCPSPMPVSTSGDRYLTARS